MSSDPLAMAKANGSMYYYTGTPCKNGHDSDRYTRSAACVQCHKLAMAATKEKHKDRRAAQVAQRAALRDAERQALKPQRDQAARESRQRWRQENAARVKAVNDVWRSENAERMKANTDRWRKENPDRARAYTAAWAARSPDKERGRGARRYERDPQANLDRNRQWHAANPEARRLYNSSYKARKIAGGGVLSKGISAKLFKLQKGLCACCRQPLGKNYHIDHIVPLAKGGSNTDDNVQLLRQRCNHQKRDKDPIDFMQSRGFLL